MLFRLPRVFWQQLSPCHGRPFKGRAVLSSAVVIAVLGPSFRRSCVVNRIHLTTKEGASWNGSMTAMVRRTPHTPETNFSALLFHGDFSSRRLRFFCFSECRVNTKGTTVEAKESGRLLIPSLTFLCVCSPPSSPWNAPSSFSQASIRTFLCPSSKPRAVLYCPPLTGGAV